MMHHLYQHPEQQMGACDVFASQAFGKLFFFLLNHYLHLEPQQQWKNWQCSMYGHPSHPSHPLWNSGGSSRAGAANSRCVVSWGPGVSFFVFFLLYQHSNICFLYIMTVYSHCHCRSTQPWQQWGNCDEGQGWHWGGWSRWWKEAGFEMSSTSISFIVLLIILNI